MIVSFWEPTVRHTSTVPNSVHLRLCAGVFSAPNTMTCLAHVFETANVLENLEAFTSRNGPKFLWLAVEHYQKMILVKRDEPISQPSSIETTEGELTVFDPGFPQHWQVL